MEIGSRGGGGGGGGDGWDGGDDQLHGLKFGKKIYFEDAGGSGSGSGSGSASASSPPSSSSKAGGRGRKGKGKGKAVAGGSSSASAQPRCQVEGCDVDLNAFKQYYARHKVCFMHSRQSRVIVAGLEQRFCQQCSRFHQLIEFDQIKRSCRNRLAGHNERRRRPAAGTFASRYGRFAAPFEPVRSRSFQVDFSYPRVPSSVRGAWPAVRPGSRMPGSFQWQGSLDHHAHPSAFLGYGAHAYSSQGSSSAGPPVFHGPGLPLGGCLTGVAADSSCALSLLSTQPWDTTHGASHNRAAAMPSSVGFDGNPVAPLVMASNYMTQSPWTGSRGHEGGQNVPHQLPNEVRLDEVHPDSSHQRQFSGELELALQGNGPAPEQRMDHGSSSAFDQAGSSSHWSP